MTGIYRAVLFDLDGTLTPVTSVWQHIHEALGLWDSEARRHQHEFELGAISYEEFCVRDAAHWKGMPESKLRAISDRIPYRPGARECDRQSAGGREGLRRRRLRRLPHARRGGLDGQRRTRSRPAEAVRSGCSETGRERRRCHAGLQGSAHSGPDHRRREVRQLGRRQVDRAGCHKRRLPSATYGG